MSINYDHKANLHTVTGPQIALPFIIGDVSTHSVLDVGCGLGTWLKAFAELGVQDYLGIDGIDIPAGELLIDRNHFKAVDLSKPWHLGRKFDLAICLEVVEHLPSDSSEAFIKALCEHSDCVVFSGACPQQPGQAHINCRWPEFWQELFNQNGFTCEDDIRPKIWSEKRIEVWYRQNIFSARRSDQAGLEPRIRGMVHPEFFHGLTREAVEAASKAAIERTYNQISTGAFPAAEYPKIVAKAFVSKLRRRFADKSKPPR